MSQFTNCVTIADGISVRSSHAKSAQCNLAYNRYFGECNDSTPIGRADVSRAVDMKSFPLGQYLWRDCCFRSRAYPG